MDENFTPDTLRACFADCDDDVLLPGGFALADASVAARLFAAVWEADRERLEKAEKVVDAAKALVELWTEADHVITEYEAEDTLVDALAELAK